jgi:hypothetical protein
MDKRVTFVVAVLLLVTLQASLAKMFTRCGLAAELKKHGITDTRNCE